MASQTLKQLSSTITDIAKSGIKCETPIKWFNVTTMSILHIGAFYGLYLMLTTAKFETVLFWYFCGVLSAQGITAGAHRLWTHRAYKARLPLRIVLMLFNSIALQNDIYTWSRDHRVHHKFSDTDADPHNSNRGFFFAHMGWLLCKKHPEVLRKGKSVDVSDLLKDPVIVFQQRYYLPLIILMSFVIPTVVPMWFWNETFLNSLFVCAFLRYCYTLHCTWLVNSAAHFWGMVQYDKSIEPRESWLATYCTYGEGYHNYHHVFPYDYSASELGWAYNLNLTTMFIDFCSSIGLAYDLKKVSPAIIENRVQRTGDNQLHKEQHNKSTVNVAAKFVLSTGASFCHVWIPLLIRLITAV